MGQEQYKEFTALEKAVTDIESTVKNAIGKADAANGKKHFSNSTSMRYSLNPEFTKSLDEWDGSPSRTFKVGSTSDVLQELGVEKRDIIWRAGKIKTILEKHEGMTIDIIKQVPGILENPIIVLKSAQKSAANNSESSRLVIFGEVLDTNNAPVMAALELNPANMVGKLLDLNIVTSAYGKTGNVKSFIEKSDVVYLNEDKNKTNMWLQSLGLQLPPGITTYGSIGSVSYADGLVKIQGVPFTSITDIEESVAANDMQETANDTPIDQSTKLSLQGSSELQRENAKLNALNAHLREQMKISTVIKTDPRGVEKIAKTILKENSSSYNVDEFTDQLQEIYDFIANNGNETAELTFEAIKEMAESTAMNALNETSILNDELYKEYSEVLDSLKPIYESIPSGELGYEASSLAGEILESFYAVPQQAPTFADMQQEKLTKQKVLGETGRRIPQDQSTATNSVINQIQATTAYTEMSQAYKEKRATKLKFTPMQ